MEECEEDIKTVHVAGQEVGYLTGLGLAHRVFRDSEGFTINEGSEADSHLHSEMLYSEFVGVVAGRVEDGEADNAKGEKVAGIPLVGGWVVEVVEKVAEEDGLSDSVILKKD